MKALTARTLLLLVALASSCTAFAQYKLTALVENLPNKAPHTDPNLVNAWGLARSSGSPFWISDNVTGLSTLYDGSGNPQSLVVTIPAQADGAKGSPTGIVFNGSSDFVVSQNGVSGAAIFIFASLDGSISGWNPTVNLNSAILAPTQNTGALYTGLAISSGTNGNFLYAADALNNRVDVFDGSFHLIKTLTDSTVPQGFSVYGIQDLNGKVYVTYASDGNAPGGFIDIFTEEGAFVKRFTEGGTLNQPWGLALAPRNFGPFSTAILIGNNTTDGTIGAFNASSGKFLGKLTDASGKVIHIDQLWGLEFGGGATTNGAVNQLFFTAGPDNYGQGEFGVIEFAGK